MLTLIVCAVLLWVFTCWVSCFVFCIGTMFGSSLHQVVCRKDHVFFYVICVCVYSGVQHVLCWVFYFVFRHFVYPMLPVSLGWLFLIAPSIFSNICLEQDTNYHPYKLIYTSWIVCYLDLCNVRTCNALVYTTFSMTEPYFKLIALFLTFSCCSGYF